MKRILLTTIILFTFVFTGLFAQTTKSDYFINSSTTRSLLNPALRPTQGYVGIPALSNVYIDVKTNRLNLDHLVFEKDGYSKPLNFMHSAVSASEFLDGIAKNNYLATDVNLRILSAGWYSGDGFWSIDVNARTHADMNVPKSLFELLKVGFSSEPDESFRYDLKNIGGNVSGYVETGVGYSKPFLENSLVVGAKAKVLFGLGNIDFNIDRLDINYENRRWIARSQASLNGSVKGMTATYDDDQFDGLDFDSFGLAGFGLGFDLGGVYDFKNMSENISDETFSEILSRTKVSLAFTDIGFISWSGSSSLHLVSPDEAIEITPESNWDGDGKSFEDHLTDVMDEFEEVLNFKDGPDAGKGRSTSLRTNMNIGLEYEAWKDNLTVGLLSSTQFGKYHTTSEFTLSANYNPNKSWFATTLSYSFVHSKFNTFGLAIHLAPSKGLNLFIASDYIIPHVNKEFIPVTSKAVNVQFGFTVPIGAKRL